VSKGDFGSLAIGQFGAPGDILILLGAVNWAVFTILSRRGLHTYPATGMMFYVMVLGWGFTWLLLLPGPGFRELPQLTASGWVSVGFLGIFCSGLAYIFWYDALQRLPASQVGVFLYLQPLVVVAALVLGERIGLVPLLGGATILLGVWLVNKPQAIPAPRTEPQPLEI